MPVVTYSLYNRDADVCVERLRLNMEETQVLHMRWHVPGERSMLGLLAMHAFCAEPHLAPIGNLSCREYAASLDTYLKHVLPPPRTLRPTG